MGMFKTPIPKLCAEDIEVKVKQVFEKGAVALLYKTSRTDMRILDECVGPDNWQDSYSEIKGNLYCTIRIRNPETGEWVGKSDCGIESREDGEGNQKKGEASDAFKRAGVKWGIGRELYTSPFIFLNVKTKVLPGSGKPRYELADRFARYSVKSITYDASGSIKSVVIVDSEKNQVFPSKKVKDDVGDMQPEQIPPPQYTTGPIYVGSAHIATMLAELARVGKGTDYLLQRVNEHFRAAVTAIEQVTIEQFKWVMMRLEKTPSAVGESA